MTAGASGGAITIPPPAPFPQEAAGAVAAPGGSPEHVATMLRSLLLLDPALERWSRRRKRRDMLKRLASGVIGHFRDRAPEWFACFLLLQIGSTLYLPPPAFPLSQGWSVMAKQMPEESWGVLFLLLGLLRFAALAVNGTFRRFRFSPHIRCATAFLACGLWLQVVFSVYEAAPDGVLFVIARLFMLLELYNVWRAASDVGHTAKRSGDD